MGYDIKVVKISHERANLLPAFSNFINELHIYIQCKDFYYEI